MLLRSATFSILTAVALAGAVVLDVQLRWQWPWPVWLPSLLLGGAGAWWLHRQHPRGMDFGWPNRVTLLRAALLVLLLPVLWVPVGPTLAWIVCLAATLAALLDALDGALARRLRVASAFGARFDMETDGLFVGVLALLVWQLDRAGPWVLIGGLLRPALLLALRVWPVLARPLPPSLRRKRVAGLQMVVLPLALCPLLSVPWASALCALALLLLLWSFAVDVQGLLRT